MNYLCRYSCCNTSFFSTKSQCAILKLVVHTLTNILFWHGKIGFSCIHTTNFIVRRLDADLFLTRNPNIFTKAQWSEFPNFIQQLKVSKSRKQFMVSSILPKNKQKQFNLRYHKSKVEFVHSFFGRIEATINPSIYNILRWVAWMMGQANCRPRVWCSKYYLFLYFL